MAPDDPPDRPPDDPFAATARLHARAARTQAQFLLTEVRAGLLAADDMAFTALTADERDELTRLHADLGARLQADT